MANYPVPYQNNYGYSGVIGQQLYPQYAAQNMTQQQTPTVQPGGHGIIWVDGEVGAKAYQFPAGWPANQPLALWDTNDTVIYIKSCNAMGMPNPIQRARYVLEDANSGEKTRGYSGDAKPEMPDMSEYVKKEDLERLKQDLMDAIGSTTANARRQTRGE